MSIATYADSSAVVKLYADEADYFGTETSPPRFVVLAVTPTILEDAARLVGVHGLRAYDGVQLASARAASQAVGEDLTFATFDKSLCVAGAAEGLDLLP